MTEISFVHGFLIRKAALREKGISNGDLFKVMEVVSPLGESKELFSFGPNFGKEAANELSNRLQKLGLTYWDDFFETTFDHPDWCSFLAC